MGASPRLSLWTGFKSSIRTQWSEIKKIIHVWCVLTLAAFFIVPAWPVVFNCNFNCERFLSAHNRRIIAATNLPTKVDGLIRENSIWTIRKTLASLFDSTNKYFPSTEKVSARNWTEILDSCTKMQVARLVSPYGTCNKLAARIFPKMIVLYPLYADIGPIRSVERLVGCYYKISSRTSLPESNAGVCEQKSYSDKFSNKFVLIPGILLIASSLVLLYKIWWKVSFDLSANYNVIWFIIQFMTSLGMFVAGGMLLFLAFGLL